MKSADEKPDALPEPDSDVKPNPKSGVKAAAKPGTKPAEIGFEDALGRLEELVARLEAGELPLEETIRTFEEGQKLLALCGDLLGKAELRVKEVLRRADGGLEETDWKGEGDASA